MIRSDESRIATIVVTFDQQQYQLLEFLRQEGAYGTEDAEILRAVVLEYLAELEGQEHRAQEATDPKG